MKAIKINDKIDDYEVTFITDTYADMFQRKAVLAIVASGDEEGELYGDVTINIPQYSLFKEDGEDAFLSNSCPELIDAMVKNGYLEIVREAKVNYGTYKVGKFTQKFADDFENESKQEMDNQNFETHQNEFDSISEEKVAKEYVSLYQILSDIFKEEDEMEAGE